MTWNYANTPTNWLSFFTVLLLIALAVYSWSRRSVPGALAFAVALTFAALWAAGTALEHTALDMAAKIGWVKFQAAWQLPTATAVTCFIVEYAWPGRWVNRRNVAMLSVPPLLIILLILTNDSHNLMWRGFATDKSFTPLLGPVSWIAITYGYGFVLVDIIVFAWLFWRSPQHRWFVVVMLAGQIPVRVLYLLEKSQVLQSDLPIDVFGIAFAYLMYTTALFRFHILHPIQLARQTVIAQMREGMLVLDNEGRVSSLNPAAERIFGTLARQVKGQPIRDLIPAYSEGYIDDTQVTEFEFAFDTRQERLRQEVVEKIVHQYTVAISSLKDWRGLAVGRLLLLHDITAQKQAQSQIVEQQRALATLKEREQVARELHDHLSQELALINVQAQLVGGLLEEGQTDQARAQLQLLAKVARETQVDVRGEIRTLSLKASSEEGFLEALRQFLDIFQQSYGIETELVLPGDLSRISLTPTVAVQLLRIVQEALANIRKHAQAKHVRVTLSREPGCVGLIIEDDGIGFDSEALPAPGHTFGLGFMSERAEEINAQVEVLSALGTGTRIALKVPVELPVNSNH
jgi:PAS domain S-box-containing protein